MKRENRISKRMKQADKLINKEKLFILDEAIDQLQKFPKAKFDETIELHFHLNVDPKASEQSLRGTVGLPHGTGKKIKIAVFCKGELETKAKNAGADFVGAQELIEKVANGFMDFDVVISAPDMMRDLSKLGKVLGPRGLMPTPKAGTVTMDIEKAIKDIKAGKIEFKSDKQSGIHVGIGKRSFTKQQIIENARQVIDSVNQAKPASVKGVYVKSIYVSSTMGAGVKVAL